LLNASRAVRVPVTRRPGVLDADSIARGALSAVDYLDVYGTTVEEGASLEGVAHRVLAGRPSSLMRLRDALVRPFGLKVSPTGLRQRPSFLVGERVGIFTVFARTQDELLLGEDDRHLDFRVCLSVRPDGQATLATLVRFNNVWGRAYFALVRPFHALVVKRMLGRASRQLPG
jgi:Protein of unknown function (DUF2867)